MKHLFALFTLLIGIFALALPVSAADQVHYTSTPDELIVFLNDVAFARDTLMLPGGMDVSVILPGTIYADTLILRENGVRVPVYHINRNSGQVILRWQSAPGDTLREVTLDYLLSGISWTPTYDMWLLGTHDSGDDEPVQFDFFAEVSNRALTLDDATIRLAAGRVDTAQQLSAVSTITMNQMVAGYDNFSATEPPKLTGAATIRHLYDAPNLTASPGDVIYISLQEQALTARRLHLWNAQSDDQVTVIYKVRNDSALPFAEGIVRTYEGGQFTGSDFVELTPIGSEGSVTVGHLQNVRVSRSETRTALTVLTSWDTLREIELTLSNYGEEAVEISIVDRYPPHAIGFEFSMQAEFQGDNLLRWEVTIPAGETLTLSYTFKAYD